MALLQLRAGQGAVAVGVDRAESPGQEALGGLGRGECLVAIPVEVGHQAFGGGPGIDFEARARVGVARDRPLSEGPDPMQPLDPSPMPANPGPIRSVRLWSSALVAGLLAGIAAWLGGEAIQGRFDSI